MVVNTPTICYFKTLPECILKKNRFIYFVKKLLVLGEER